MGREASGDLLLLVIQSLLDGFDSLVQSDAGGYEAALALKLRVVLQPGGGRFFDIIHQAVDAGDNRVEQRREDICLESLRANVSTTPDSVQRKIGRAHV